MVKKSLLFHFSIFCSIPTNPGFYFWYTKHWAPSHARKLCKGGKPTAAAMKGGSAKININLLNGKLSMLGSKNHVYSQLRHKTLFIKIEGSYIDSTHYFDELVW